jgi:uncharacterized protein (DUF1501 family)
MMSTSADFAAHPAIPTDRDILVCVFQRGAADGLNSLAPYSDPDYALKRPNIALPPPGQAGGGIYLSDDYALHPALWPLKPIYDAGDLALIHATGVPHNNRSHFIAQNLVERGVVEKLGPKNGWLGRHLALSTPESDSDFRAIAISGNVPVTLHGKVEALALDNLDDLGFAPNITETGYPHILDKLFHGETPYSGPANAALRALIELRKANPTEIAPANGALYPNSALGNRLRQAGQLIKSELPVEVICLDSDGWDHHESLPTYIDLSLAELAEALAAFYTDMGSGMARISVLVFSEFGRRVAENGSLGADHGSASLAYLMGGGVNGGQIISDWPGLDVANLDQGEDLRITTDLRSLLAELLNKRLGGTDVSRVFPGFGGVTDVNALLG